MLSVWHVLRIRKKNKIEQEGGRISLLVLAGSADVNQHGTARIFPSLAQGLHLLIKCLQLLQLLQGTIITKCCNITS